MSTNSSNSAQQPVDICLLLEGTYPYVRGGVSSWLHQIIEGLNEYTFHIIFLGGDPGFRISESLVISFFFETRLLI